MIPPELPQNIEAEHATLGSLITNRDAIVMVTNWLTPDMFYLDRHGAIYAAIQRLFSRREPPDLRTVSDELRRGGQLETIGGLPYLVSLSDSVVTSYHVEYYAREVERCAVLRRLITASTQIARIGYDQSQDADTALGSAQKLLADISSRMVRGGLVPLSDLVDREYHRLEQAADDSASALPGCRTGFYDLDDLTGGLQDSDLILLAARPSVGKSSLMACLARGCASVGERDALIFSLEMSADQLTQRLTAIQSGVDSSRIRTLRMSESDVGAFMNALGKLSEVAIAIDDTPAVSVSAIRTAAFRHQAARGRPLVIFVDYLQLMSAPGFRPDDRVGIVSAISRDLKSLAKELNCPIVALSQLSRAVESRQSKVPILSDLRESGTQEQDADIVLFIYREELYDATTDKKGIAELHIAKHRNGPIGVVPLRFDAQTTRFDNLSNPFGGPPWQR